MIHSNSPATYFHAIKVVDCENGASLVFVAEEAKSFRFPRFLVAHQIYVYRFTVSTKRTNNTYSTKNTVGKGYNVIKLISPIHQSTNNASINQSINPLSFNQSTAHVLGENTNDIPFRQFERQSSNKNPGTVFILLMPRVAVGDSQTSFPFVELVDFSGICQRIHGRCSVVTLQRRGAQSDYKTRPRSISASPC